MRIRKYDLVLTRLRESDIELVRTKRNDPEIRKSMHFRDEISREDQIYWFRSVNNIYNNYFIISFEGRAVGLINGKNTDFEKRFSEGGIFIWEQELIGTLVPVLSSVILADLNFIINEFEKNYIKIMNDNSRAIQYNKMLGYHPDPSFPAGENFSWYSISRNEYLQWIKKFRVAIGNLTGDYEPLGWKEVDFGIYTAKEFEELYLRLPEPWLSQIRLHQEKYPCKFI
jgi:UDP-4-amino-4,6-dideoxy-N-acetyl-beta-L-altrosamine N-acetyltransferase